MDLKKIIKKLPFSEPFSCALSSKRKVVSGFGLGVGASLLVLLLIVILLCDPFKVSVLNSMLQGFNGFTGNSSLVSLPFSFSNTAGSSRDLQRNGGGGVQGKTGKVVTEETRNFSGWVQEETGKAVTEERRNFSQKGKDQSFLSEDLKGFEKTHRGNLSGEVNNASFSSKEETIVKKSYGEKPSEGDKNESLKDVTENNQGGKDRVADKSTKGNVSNNGENVGSPDGKERVSIHEGGFFKKDKTENSNNSYGLVKRLGNYSGNCDIFYGRWVRDDEKPYYPAGSCPHIDRDFDCHLHGRPDDDFLRWRWQPNGCDIPRLNATDFLERLRGKRLVFVGDSLNRNMWESLVCILRHGVTNKKRVYEISGRKEFKTKGFYAFRYEDYNCSIDFVSAPFLVRESSFKGRNGSIETLRLDLMDRTASFYREADVVVFNTGHWWTHEKTSKGEDYYQEGNHVHPRLKVLVAYQKALTTWARWVDKSINTNRTQVFFRGYSVTHFRGGQWNSGGQCHKETEPIFNETYLAKYPSKMRALEHVLQQMKTPVVYLNISRLTDYRKDGHPSIYRKEYMTVEERTAAEKSQDCSHWCLPGVPDTWNELLYASLLEAGRGSWRN